MDYKNFTKKDYLEMKKYVFNNIKNNTMLDLIIDFIERNNFFIGDVAEFIKNDEQFKNLFENNLKKHKQIYYIKDKGIQYGNEDFEIW